ncbi:hypothetical protein LJC36_03155 [Desulfovibrio sp. OttesenSCG-928-C14]|nr:hypothetical protein [Desulfovibrio sp. OttesenSCG-928-C14]
MKRLIQICTFFICILMLGQSAMAAAKTFIVLPFAVNGPDQYKYLGKSLPPMVASRLHWAGNVELSPNEEMVPDTLPGSDGEVRSLLQKTGADYAVWGSVTILGDDCSIDANVLEKNGKKWPVSRQSKVNTLIPGVSAVTDNISTEVFKRPAPAGATAARQPQGGGQQSYLNPAIRYEGGSASDTTRIRTQQLAYQGYGMEIVDADLDGQNEIFIFDDYNLYAYKYENGRLRQLSSIRINLTQNNVAIRSYQFEIGERPKIILTSIDKENMPRARVFDFDGTKFNLEIDDIRYFLSVIRDLNTRKDILIGQPGHTYDMFKQGGITQMHRQGKKLVPGEKVAVPAELNVYSFCYLPGGRDITDDPKIVAIAKNEKMRVYSLGGSRLSTSQDDYSGSPIGIEINPTRPGFGEDKEAIRALYYVPIRMIPTDLDQDGNWEIITSYAITSTGQIFKRYRNFLQSEVHALYWDGVGMTQQWRTRTVQGGVVDLALADLNNDGKTDLVLCVNVGGPLGAKKTVVVGYTLDTNIDQISIDGDFVRSSGGY